MKYQEHTNYAAYKRQADQMYHKLSKLKREGSDEELQHYFKYLKGTRLYKQAGGLYCQILCDVGA